MSKKGLLTAIVFLVAILVMSIFSSIKKYQQDTYIKKQPITTTDTFNCDNGDFQGTFRCSRLCYIVNVHLQNYKITDIKLIKSPSLVYKRKALQIIDSVITKQSLNVQPISGASIESKALLLAIDNALRNCHAQQNSSL